MSAARWQSLAGSAFAVAIMAAVLLVYGKDLARVDFGNPALPPALAGAVVLYLLVVLSGALCWRIILTAFGVKPPPWLPERQLLLSQIGKYIPGNIAQYVGRAALTVASGVPARIAGLAMVTETAVILGAGFMAVILSILLYPSLLGEIERILPQGRGLLWIGLAVAAFFLLLTGSTLAARFSKRLAGLPKVRLGPVGFALALSTAAFLLLGWSLHVLVLALATAPVPLSLSVTVFSAAWIAGLATPGAPGGLGVREALLTLGLAPFLGGASALSAALLYRGVSVAGDALAFGLGLLLPNHQAGSDQPAIR